MSIIKKIYFFFFILLTNIKKYYIILSEKFKNEKNLEDKKMLVVNNDENGKKEKENLSKGDMVIVPFDLLEIEEGFNFRLFEDKEALQELEEDVKKNGVMTPFRIQPKSGGGYYVRDGHRRFKCIKSLREKGELFERVPAIIFPAGMSELEVIQACYSTQKSKSLTGLEKGQLFYKLINQFRKTSKEVAEMLSISEGTVLNYLMLWQKATPEMIEKIKKGEVKVTEAVKQVRSGRENIEMSLDEEKKEKKEKENAIKAGMVQFLYDINDMLDKINEKEKREFLEMWGETIDYLLTKYEKYDRTDPIPQKEEKVDIKKEESKKRGRPKKNEVKDDVPEEEEEIVEDEEENDDVKEMEDDEEILDEIEKEEVDEEDIKLDEMTDEDFNLTDKDLEM